MTRAFITYLRGEAFQFYQRWITVLGELKKDTIDYNWVKQVFNERLERKWDAQVVIESALVDENGKNKAFFPFFDKDYKPYEEVKFTEGKIFVFLSKATLKSGKIRQFVVIHAPKSFSDLIKTLQEYKNSC